MMKKTDFPVRSGSGQSLFEPSHLFGIEIGSINGKELYIAFLEGIVSLAIHVEEFVEALIGIVVVAEGRIKLHPRIDQRLIRDLKLFLHIKRALTPVDVVSEHDYEIEREFFVEAQHRLRNFVLRWFPCAIVPDGGESH